MKDILLLGLILSCFISFSKSKMFFASNIIDTKEKLNNFLDIENNASFNNNISLENVYDLYVNEKKNITISNLTQFVFTLKNLTINSEINLAIGPRGNNIRFENIIIDDNELSNINTSNGNSIYYTPKNETVKFEVRVNLKNNETKNNSFYVSFIKIEKKTKKALRDSAFYIGIIWGLFSLIFDLSVISFISEGKVGSICENFTAAFCCCCCKKKTKIKSSKKKFR